MSIICGLPLLECVYCLACARWAWKRCLYTAGHDSETWGLATPEEFEPIPRLCRYILAVYEEDLRRPMWEPPSGYGIDPDCIVMRKDYEDTHGQAPPYLIYLDHDHADIVLAVRGLNLAKESDYAVLLDNKLGKRKFDGGYVHNGLLKAAACVLNAECDILREMVEKYPNYTLTFTGHSLGSGVAALLTVVVVLNRHRLGNVERKRIRCYAIAPARCMSLNLAVRYADVINSVIIEAFIVLGIEFSEGEDCSSIFSFWDAIYIVLFLYLNGIDWISNITTDSSCTHIEPLLTQIDNDDFLPRTATPLEDIFKSLFCLPCLLCLRCLGDTCIPEDKMLKDPRRLYAPGRLYHIVERKPFRCGRFPPVVKTAVPVDGRFEHIVLSCNATSDHAIIWIEREAERALELMLEKDHTLAIPAQQRMERQESLTKDHSNEYQAALRRAVSLAVPHAFSPSQYGTFDERDDADSPHSIGDSSTGSSAKSKSQESWDELIERLFERDKAGHMVLKRPLNA
ncbi:alpha/beta-Hydrolases superfamily protein [Perilla frutescens var. frutescens]|nr:alpha/beta-Hydrolases superfamily protein [Perilla frutescens var. frutescens]